MSKSNINAVRRYLRDLHKRLVGELQKADGDAFHLREWRGNLGADTPQHWITALCLNAPVSTIPPFPPTNCRQRRARGE